MGQIAQSLVRFLRTWYVIIVPINPFVYDRPLAPELALRRQVEADLMAELARGGQSSRLVAPRRYGKTTLIGMVGAELAREGFVFAHGDFSRVRQLDDVVARLRAAWEPALDRRGTSRLWRQINRRLAGYLEVGVPGIARAGIRIPAAARPRPIEALHELLAIPERLPRGRRAFVCFDEFPELLTARDDMDGLVRSHIQHHGHAASYCFAGSQASVMRVLFEDRRRPLFAQAREVGLSPIPGAELRTWLAERIGRTGSAGRAEALARAIVERTDGHPQRALMLAHFAWERVGDLDAALTDAVGQASGEIEQMWRDLEPGQRRALATAAAGYRHLLGSDALAASGSAKTTMQAARRALLTDGHLREVDGGVQVTDPFVPLWLAG